MIDVTCDRCGHKFIPEDDGLVVLRMYAVTKREAMRMDCGEVMAYEDDFHLCDSCFGLVDEFIEGKKER